MIHGAVIRGVVVTMLLLVRGGIRRGPVVSMGIGSRLAPGGLGGNVAMMPVMLGESRSGEDERGARRAGQSEPPHAPGPITVTVCIMPACMW